MATQQFAPLSIAVGNLQPLLKKYDPKIILGTPLQGLLTKAALLGERTAKLGAPRNIGDLQRDITSEVKGIDARVFTRRDLLYYRVMESGRGIGKAQPPVAAIAIWAARKGIDIPPFVLARSIKRRGIKGRFFMKAAGAVVKRELGPLARTMAKDVVREFKKA